MVFATAYMIIWQGITLTHNFPGHLLTQAQRYMESLPKESQPIRGTAGAQTRNQAMQRQLPDHDQHTEACHNLTEKEKEKMNEFVQSYKVLRNYDMHVYDWLIKGKISAIHTPNLHNALFSNPNSHVKYLK